MRRQVETMTRENVRVVVASEHLEARSLLEKMVEREGGVTVGQASDASKTLALVRNLKPDVAIIDCYLPYVLSLHTQPLSRTGGLDAAQTINQAVPGTKVVLLSNLDTVFPDYAFTRPDGMSYSLKALENDLPLVIRNMHPAAPANKTVLFASIEAKAQEVVKPARTNPCDVVILVGVSSIALGWFLIIGMISPTLGVIFGLAGIASVMLGYAAKYTQSWWRRVLQKRRSTMT